MRRQLAPQVAPRYIVQLEEPIFIHDLPPEPRRLTGRADLSVTRTQAAPAGAAALGVLEAPAEVRLPLQDLARALADERVVLGDEDRDGVHRDTSLGAAGGIHRPDARVQPSMKRARTNPPIHSP